VNNDAMVKKPLEELLDSDTNDMIKCLASKYRTKYSRYNNSSMISQGDLVSEGYIGATVAYQTFDPTKASFRTYAFPYIINAMLTYCRKFSHALSISERSAREDFPMIAGISVIHIDQYDDDTEFDIPVGSGVETTQDVDEYFLIGFNDFERELIKEYMLDEYSLQDLAIRHNMSKSRIGEIMRGLTDRMKMRAQNYDKDD
jgi:RNA polymerase sigma factor (sigma-70 family)